MLVSLSVSRCAFAFADSSSNKTIVISRVELKRYFEKAMYLFEAGNYKEAIIAFEDLIKIETSQNEAYFTPFAEIYIEKSKSRMRELHVLEEKRWKKMKEDVISEEERIAKEAAKEIAKAKEEMKRKFEEEQMRREEEIRGEFKEEQRRREAGMKSKLEEQVLRQEEMERRLQAEEVKKKKAYELTQRSELIYAEALGYYKRKDYPQAIIEFKKIKELDPGSKLVSKAESFIEKSRKEIKEKGKRELLIKMEAAKQAKIEMERENSLRQIEKNRKEKQKDRLKQLFEEKVKYSIVKERVVKIKGFMDTIRKHVSENDFDEAEHVLNEAMAEFPENKRFEDILHYVEIQKVKIEEKALKRAREIVEEKMLLEVAKKHIIPEEKEGVLKKEKKITPLVKIPEIRRRLKIPISIDFKDVELDYVLSFLSDATSVNIVPSSEIDMGEKYVTIRIKDMPLEEALRYILKSQDLVYRIEEDAVWVATEEELGNERIETRVYFLEQGVGGFSELTSVSTTSSEVKTVKDILESTVDWPKDSKLTSDDRTGALIISNVPSNLEIIENLLYTLDVTPVQVLIEARFLEVQVTDVDEFGFEWQLNSDWGLSQNQAKQNLHGFASGSGVDFTTFSRQDEGFNLTYQGILSHPQFQVVMHALKEKQNVKTLSAPRITTLNNQIATIEVIDEYIYPTRYEVSLVQFDINGDGDFDDAGETEWANIPQDFVTRDVGILLHVKPSVGVDKKTITMALTPEVSESSSSYTYSGDVSIPQFKTRNLSTSIILESGETVVLGGLIRETNTKVETKVPLLGDLPFIGGLFRKNTDSVERRNLLIFVTATVLNKEENAMASVPEFEAAGFKNEI
ncbi:MAG: hypothetical protein KJ957_03235 [Candidatus Omnitrophica bacterium]|nr:hypothetical protein [Candidatus Omnitrophota bacterium]